MRRGIDTDYTIWTDKQKIKIKKSKILEQSSKTSKFTQFVNKI